MNERLQELARIGTVTDYRSAYRGGPPVGCEWLATVYINGAYVEFWDPCKGEGIRATWADTDKTLSGQGLTPVDAYLSLLDATAEHERRRLLSVPVQDAGQQMQTEPTPAERAAELAKRERIPFGDALKQIRAGKWP